VINRRLQPDRWSKLVSLAVGLGIARSLDFQFAPLEAKLKWPNDVHLGGGKVAGVLIETNQNVAERIVIGVGVNVAVTPDLGDDPAAGQIRSVAQSVGRRVDRYELLAPIVANIQQRLEQLDKDPNEVVDEFRSKCLLTGHTVSFRDRQGDHEGTCSSINESGELIVETTSGRQILQSGEARLVRLRPSH
jgi:BirA family biotin operon repressor/biotin-[acetyl-CoA-carboxylase] ligase